MLSNKTLTTINRSLIGFLCWLEGQVRRAYITNLCGDTWFLILGALFSCSHRRIETKNKVVPLLVTNKPQQLFNCRQAWTRAQLAALHCRYRIAEFHAGLDVLTTEKSINKTAMKRITRAGCIATTIRRSKRRRFNKLTVAVDQGSIFPKRHPH